MTQPFPDFHRTNINLHASDVRWFQTHYGYGWTERVRDLIHNWVLNEGALDEEEKHSWLGAYPDE